MNHQFNRGKLEEAMLTDNKEFIAEEWERCKDPRYFYNTYWQVDGKPVNPISEEQWNSYLEMQENSRNNYVKKRSSILSEGLIRSVEEIDRLVLKRRK